MLIGSSSGIGLTFHFTRLAITLRRMGNEVIVLSDRKEQYAELPVELNRFGIPHYTSDVLHAINPVGVIKATGDIRKIFQREDIDIILGGGVKEGIKVFLAVKRPSKPKSFSVIGSLPQGKYELKIAKFAYSHFYDGCIALCNYTKNELERIGVVSHKIYVIPLFAPDLEWFDKVKEVRICLKDYNLENLTKPVIFYAASQNPHKNFGCYLKAASEVLKRFDATFVLGGKGPLTQSLKVLAEKLGISKNVVFTGWISNYHMPYILSNIADICVSTSLVEQLPSYIMECMAAGKPVVSYSVAGIPELITDSINGFLTSPKDHLTIANRIIDLVNDNNLAKEMGLKNRGIIEKKFNMETAARTLESLYELRKR